MRANMICDKRCGVELSAAARAYGKSEDDDDAAVRWRVSCASVRTSRRAIESTSLCFWPMFHGGRDGNGCGNLYVMLQSVKLIELTSVSMRVR